MEVFQALNVLSDEEYSQLMAIKQQVFRQRTGEITIESDGKTTTRYQGKNGLHLEQNSINNYRMDIEGFRVIYPDIFIKLLYAIQNKLKENGLTNPKPYISRTYARNDIKEWHKHVIYGDNKNLDYCVIYYMHPNWDTKNGGRLNVSKTPSVPYKSFDCLSNSLVAHNGRYGHSVDFLNKNYEGSRDIFLSHWIVE